MTEVRAGEGTANAPIFVVGVPRSGTTLLMALLGSHPRIACGPETHFFAYLHPEIEAALADPATWPDPAVAYLDAIRPYGESPLDRYDLTPVAIRARLVDRPPSVRSILAGLVDAHAERLGKPRWAEKTPAHILYLDAIRAHFPDAAILKLVRDPRDVALSLRSMPWGPATWAEALQIWASMEQTSRPWMQGDPRSRVIYYEDLVTDPATTLRGVSDWLGEAFDPAMLDQASTASQVISTPHWWNTKPAGPIDPKRARGWRGCLGPAEIRAAHEVLRATEMHLDRYPTEA